MSIVTEYYKTRSDGVVLNRTYSDAGKLLIRNDGTEFSEAVDVENAPYTYTESENDIPSYPESHDWDDVWDETNEAYQKGVNSV